MQSTRGDGMKMKKRVSVYLSLIAAGILLLSSMASADGTVYRWVGGLPGLIWGLPYSDGDETLLIVKEYKDGELTGDSILAYCIDQNNEIYNWGDYRQYSLEHAFTYTTTAATTLAAKFIRSIVIGSYPNISLDQLEKDVAKSGRTISGLTKEEAISGTQRAIWSYSNPKFKPSSFDNENAQAVMDYLKDFGPTSRKSQTVITLTQPTYSVEENKNQVVVSYSYSAMTEEGRFVPLDVTYSKTFSGASYNETYDDSTGITKVELTLPMDEYQEDEVLTIKVNGVQSEAYALVQDLTELPEDISYYGSDPINGTDDPREWTEEDLNQALVFVESEPISESVDVSYKLDHDTKKPKKRTPKKETPIVEEPPTDPPKSPEEPPVVPETPKEPEEEILDEEIAEDLPVALPETGGIPAEAFSLIGTMVAGAGVYIKRKYK